MKRCFKCLRDLPIEEFYRHGNTADRHLGKCKECARKDVREARLARIEHVREYDRWRAKLPHRIALSKAVYERWSAAHPERARAQQTASNAVRDGKLERVTECEGCGRSDRRLDKHHPDYSKPLLVVWFCKPCHAIADKIRRRLEAS